MISIWKFVVDVSRRQNITNADKSLSFFLWSTRDQKNETPLNVKTIIARAAFSRTDFDFSLFKGS